MKNRSFATTGLSGLVYKPFVALSLVLHWTFLGEKTPLDWAGSARLHPLHPPDGQPEPHQSPAGNRQSGPGEERRSLGRDREILGQHQRSQQKHFESHVKANLSSKEVTKYYKDCEIWHLEKKSYRLNSPHYKSSWKFLEIV